MSMSCTLSRVTSEQMQAMRGDPAIADALLHETLFTAQPKRGLLARLFGKTAPMLARASSSWIGAAHQYDLDHQWHILHFLLTGQAEGGDFPAHFICNGGEEVGSDTGYGAPRLFTNEQVRDIAAHLTAITEADLRERYIASEIERQEIYWKVPDTREEQREDADELADTLAEAARFIDETARRGCGLVVEIY